MNHTQPLTFVLFGATGDLAQRKIMPALLNLFVSGTLPARSSIIAFSRRTWTDQEYRNFIKPSLEKHQADLAVLQTFLQNIQYVKGTFDERDSYARLKEMVGETQAVFHLAIQPEFYETVFNELGIAKLQENNAKIIIEKPFGHNSETAKQLETTLSQHFTEAQIFRIDHYLGKEGLHNIIIERNQNQELENKLSAANVQSIEVRMLEDLDIAGRGEFFETIGALRDIGQNHILEMLAVILMDIIKDEELSHARGRVLIDLKSLQAADSPKIRRAQYEGYRKEQDVDPQSETETYFKVETAMQNKRWNGVKIILEGGKAMAEKKSEIKIVFKDDTEKIFDIRDGTRDAYEILIEQAILGKHEWFVSIDEVMASWKFIDSVIDQFKKVPLTVYKKGNTP
ncbi:MAG: hypothetical protein M3Q73_03855 [bacterium]|nr:hypothetical protein [bacterium]